MLKLAPNPVVYRGTLAGLRISSVDGVALLDNCAALVPYADGLHRVEIYDSAGRQLVGYLSAQGAGETLSGDALSGWNFTSGWSPVAGASVVDANSFSNSTESKGIYKAGILTIGALHKVVVDGSTTATVFDVIDTAGSLTFVTGFGTGYATPLANKNLYLRNKTGTGQTDITTLELYQVTAPSTDGVLIVSTKGGATRNFASVNASFVYAASHYVVVRKMR